MKTKILAQDDSSLKTAAEILLQGELVAFPTETVYGLGAPIFSPQTIAKIFAVKKRPQDNPLIAHISSIEMALTIVEKLNTECLGLMEAFFPGPLTLVLPKKKDVSSIVSGGQETIAFRMPSHPIARRLIELVKEPLVAPSANLSGKPSSTTALHVLNDFNGAIGAVIDGGECTIGIESTVLALLDKPTLLRPGKITKEEIETVLKRKIENVDSSDGKIISPGMKYRHYAPNAKVLLFETEEKLKQHVLKKQVRRKIATPTEKTLYAILREADLEGCEEVCLLCPKELPAGLMNRLLKAAF